MDIRRFFKHLFFTDAQVRRAFAPATLQAIEQAIHASEKLHSGEVRFAVEGALDSARIAAGQSARERAIEVFSQLRVWDTERNSGVLIYVLLADHAVEIVADRGIHAKAGTASWDAICKDMQAEFSKSAFHTGALGGIAAVASLMTAHFPPDGADVNELPNAPVLLK